MTRQTKALRRAIACLIIGAVANILVAWICMFVVPLKVEAQPAAAGVLTDDDKLWALFRLENGGGLVIQSTLSSAYPLVWPAPRIERPSEVLPFWARPIRPDHVHQIRFIEARGWPWRSLFLEATASFEVSDRQFQMSFQNIAGGIPLSAELPPSPQQGDPWPNLALPVRPIWSGMMLNTLLYATAVWAAVFGPGTVRSQLQRTIRISRGECEGCGYPEIHAAERCPECGASWRERHRRA